MTALSDASAKIKHDSTIGLPAPRPYLELATVGLAWIKSGRYWIAYNRATPILIAGIFFETADIPNRI